MSAPALGVAVVTGSRADYGLLRPTLHALTSDPRFDLQLLVAATHFEAAYGGTLAEIESDGFAIAGRIETGTVTSAEDVGKALATAIQGFTEALGTLGPQWLVVLGDRHEALSAALAATCCGIPIAHIHGGELSEGSLDDAHRHCITKLSHVHFVAARVYAERVCQLGEAPERVFVVGAPALEAMQTLSLLDRDALGASLDGVTLEQPLVAVTLHPTSLEPQAARAEAVAVVDGLDDALAGNGTVVITLPGDDLGNVATRDVLLDYAARRPNVHTFAALGQRRYLSLMRHADLMLGNSSSGLIEAPSFKLPVVNVGTRQQGRLRARNVVDVDANAGAIAQAIAQALEPGFRESLADLESPFGEGGVSARILEVLARPNGMLRRKRFFDLPDGEWRRQLVLGSDRR